MSAPIFPEPFRSLEPFAGWALPTETERNRKRWTSEMTEIRAFYDALVPRLEEALTYLDRYPLEGLPDEAQRLFHLTLALAEIAPAVEVYGQPQVANTEDPSRFIPVHEAGRDRKRLPMA